MAGDNERHNVKRKVDKGGRIRMVVDWRWNPMRWRAVVPAGELIVNRDRDGWNAWIRYRDERDYFLVGCYGTREEAMDAAALDAAVA